MSEAYGDSHSGRSSRLDRILSELVGQVPEVEAASVVSFDGLAMASALPAGMDEDRVAAMSAALLSLGERAAEGLGRGALSQVFIEGENGTVFLISADDEAVLVAVTAKGSKTGLMLFEVKRAAAAVAEILRAEVPYDGGSYEASPQDGGLYGASPYDGAPYAVSSLDVAPPVQPAPLQVVGQGGYGESSNETPAWS